MDWDRILQPQILTPTLALSIPILAIVFWGLKSVTYAMRGEPGDFDDWKSELIDLRKRVEELERKATRDS